MAAHPEARSVQKLPRRRIVVDSWVIPLYLIIAALFGWLEREQRDVIEFLREENRVLKAQLQGHRLRLNDDERRLWLSETRYALR
jgi:hypothetical protein